MVNYILSPRICIQPEILFHWYRLVLRLTEIRNGTVHRSTKTAGASGLLTFATLWGRRSLTGMKESHKLKILVPGDRGRAWLLSDLLNESSETQNEGLK
jgi:hypothetical protein